MSEYDERRTHITKAISQLNGLIENERLAFREGRQCQMSPLSINYMINAFEQILTLINDFERIEEKLDKLQVDTIKKEEKITLIIERFNNWTKKYQPILDKMDEEDRILKKAKKN